MQLYKYVGPERVDILRNRQIRITQPAGLNDPFELRPFFHELLSRSTMVGLLTGQTIDIESILREQLEKMAPAQRGQRSVDQVLEQVLPQLTPQVMEQGFAFALGFADELQRSAVDAVRKQITETLGKEVGIISLSELADSPPMWAHYASHHTGFVIGFNTQHRFFNSRRSESDEFYHLRKVVYRKAPIEYAELVGMTGDDILVTKRQDWEYEREWRMLIPVRFATTHTGADDNPCYLVELPMEAVSEIILGSKCSSATELLIRELLSGEEYSHIRLRRMNERADGTLVAT